MTSKEVAVRLRALRRVDVSVAQARVWKELKRAYGFSAEVDRLALGTGGGRDGEANVGQGDGCPVADGWDCGDGVGDAGHQERQEGGSYEVSPNREDALQTGSSENRTVERQDAQPFMSRS